MRENLDISIEIWLQQGRFKGRDILGILALCWHIWHCWKWVSESLFCSFSWCYGHWTSLYVSFFFIGITNENMNSPYRWRMQVSVSELHKSWLRNTHLFQFKGCGVLLGEKKCTVLDLVFIIHVFLVWLNPSPSAKRHKDKSGKKRLTHSAIDEKKYLI